MTTPTILDTTPLDEVGLTITEGTDRIRSINGVRTASGDLHIIIEVDYHIRSTAWSAGRGPDGLRTDGGTYQASGAPEMSTGAGWDRPRVEMTVASGGKDLELDTTLPNVLVIYPRTR